MTADTKILLIRLNRMPGKSVTAPTSTPCTRWARTRGRLFRRAGLADVGVESRTQMYPPGNSRRTVRLDLVRGMRPQIVAMGLAGERELDELDAAIRPHLEDPRTVAMSGLLFLVWGRKPG